MILSKYSHGIGNRKIRSRTLLLTFLLGSASLGGCSIADIRNKAVKTQGNTEESSNKGRELLKVAAERHGLAKWATYTTFESIGTDAWRGLGRFLTWWPQPKQRLAMQALLGSFTSRVELLDGKTQGEIWGIQSWAAYKITGGSSQPIYLKDKAIQFYLPTLQYFAEFPFRIPSAQIVAYAGERVLNGKQYELVFATWGSFEPNPKDDQYEVWINKEDLLIEKVTYTIREGAKWVTGTIHFDDFREIQGILFPFKQTVTLTTPEKTKYPITDDYFHQMRFDAVKFDSIPKQALLPDPNRREIGDRKLKGN